MESKDNEVKSNMAAPNTETTPQTEAVKTEATAPVDATADGAKTAPANAEGAPAGAASATDVAKDAAGKPKGPAPMPGMQRGSKSMPPKGSPVMPKGPVPGAKPKKNVQRHNYYQMMMAVIDTVKNDYAGFAEKEAINDTKYPMNMLVYTYQKKVINEVMFLRIVSQYLASLGDPNLKFSMINHDNYKNYNIGFKVRRYGNDLYVTETGRDDRMHVGDKIVTLGKMTPGEQREKFPMNFVIGNIAEREQWGGFLKMIPTFEVEHLNGTKETLQSRHFIIEKPQRTLECAALNEKTCYIRVEEFASDTSALEALLAEHASELTSCENLIIDLRKNESGSEPGFVPLLPMIFDSEEEVAALLDKEAIYTNYSKNNCAHTTQKIKAMKENYQKTNNEDAVALADQLISEFEEKSGTGFQKDVPEDDILAEYHAIHEGKEGLYKNIQKVVLLTDTWCRDTGEVFVKICAASPKVTVVGRPTMGTIDYTNYVNMSIDKAFVLSYPMSKRQNVVDGHPYNETGLPVDVYIPWTPQECTEDLLKQKAVEIVESRA